MNYLKQHGRSLHGTNAGQRQFQGSAPVCQMGKPLPVAATRFAATNGFAWRLQWKMARRITLAVSRRA